MPSLRSRMSPVCSRSPDAASSGCGTMITVALLTKFQAIVIVRGHRRRSVGLRSLGATRPAVSARPPTPGQIGGRRRSVAWSAGIISRCPSLPAASWGASSASIRGSSRPTSSSRSGRSTVVAPYATAGHEHLRHACCGMTSPVAGRHAQDDRLRAPGARRFSSWPRLPQAGERRVIWLAGVAMVLAFFNLRRRFTNATASPRCRVALVAGDDARSAVVGSRAWFVAHCHHTWCTARPPGRPGRSPRSVRLRDWTG